MPHNQRGGRGWRKNNMSSNPMRIITANYWMLLCCWYARIVSSLPKVALLVLLPTAQAWINTQHTRDSPEKKTASSFIFRILWTLKKRRRRRKRVLFVLFSVFVLPSTCADGLPAAWVFILDRVLTPLRFYVDVELTGPLSFEPMSTTNPKMMMICQVAYCSTRVPSGNRTRGRSHVRL